MHAQVRRIALAFLTGFTALTATGGGVALLSGAERTRFPLNWLAGSPFPDYTIPALLLLLVVGGSSLAACLLTLRRRRAASIINMAAGLLLAGFVVGELIFLRQVPPGPTLVEGFYFMAGMAVYLLGWYERREARQ